MQESHAKRVKRVLFSHGSVFFYLCNVQKRATKSDTLGHCLLPALILDLDSKHPKSYFQVSKEAQPGRDPCQGVEA